MLASGPRRQAKARAHSWKEPRAFCTRARVQARSRCLYARNTRCCPVPRARRHGGGRTELSAVQLRALREAGAHLPQLRPRPSLLRQWVCARAPARIIAPRPPALPTKLPRRRQTCGASARVARAARQKSDASRFSCSRLCGDSGAVDHYRDRADPCRYAIVCSAGSRALLLPEPEHREAALLLLWTGAGAVCTAGVVARKKMSVVRSPPVGKFRLHPQNDALL
jgi:hypothetical protein